MATCVNSRVTLPHHFVFQLFGLVWAINPSENGIGGFLSVVERIWDLPAAAELDWFGLSSF